MSEAALTIAAVRAAVREEVRSVRLPQWYSEEDVAEITGYSLATVRRWRKAGDLPMFRPLGNRRYRITRKAFEAWQRRVEHEGLPEEARGSRRF